MPHPPRPLSPHLSVYRWQLTSMVMSITHRITGVALSVGLVFLVLWLWAAAYNAEMFGEWQSFYGSPLGLVMLVGWLFCLYYHAFNGIRHLVWDTGHGFALKHSDLSGFLVLAATVAATGGSVAYAASQGAFHG